MIIETPEIFDYDQCLRYLTRSDQERLFYVKDRSVLRLTDIDGEKILFQIDCNTDNNLTVSFHPSSVSLNVQLTIESYIKEWFDLDTSLSDFYDTVGREPIFSKLIEEQYGSRMVRVPDLFEAISWSIIGQQINLRFAYQVKKALIESFGDQSYINENSFYLFPKPETVLEITDSEFKELQFSKQKMEYIRIVSEAIQSDQLSKARLLELGPEAAKLELIKLKGIGNWSANYVMMRCLGFREAFPVEDVGLHNALKQQLDLPKKPTTAEVRELTKHWHSWKGYRTYYLWNSLL